MTSNEATLAVIDGLEALQIPYMLVGSLSSNAYGVARSTRDADFVLELGESSIAALASRLGSAFRLDPQMTFETATMTRRYVMDVLDLPFKIEFFLLSDDPHDCERFRRRLRVPTMERETWLPTAEDVIITKVRWAAHLRRTKDRDDARDVIAVQGDGLDWPYIYSWCDQHGTRDLLDEIRRSIPPIE